MAVYAHANVGRSGLCNMLIPWARAEVFARERSVPMIAPQWVQPKIGPLLRGETDLRYYTGLFSNQGYVRGLRRLCLLGIGKRLDGDALEPGEDVHSHGRPAIVAFSGLRNYLRGLGAYSDYLRGRLWDITSQTVRNQVEEQEAIIDLAVHIRRGDMPVWEGEGDVPNCHSLPSSWFEQVIVSIREAAGRDLHVRVFSDARSGRLEDILALPGVERSPMDNTVLADLWLMSEARMLVTTGTSTLSAWASFLGGMPSVWCKGWLGEHTDHQAQHVETGPGGEIGEDELRALGAVLADEQRGSPRSRTSVRAEG